MMNKGKDQFNSINLPHLLLNAVLYDGNMPVTALASHSVQLHILARGHSHK